MQPCVGCSFWPATTRDAGASRGNARWPRAPPPALAAPPPAPSRVAAARLRRRLELRRGQARPARGAANPRRRRRPVTPRALHTLHALCMDLLHPHCVCTLRIRCARTRCHRCSSTPCSRPSARRCSSAHHRPNPWPMTTRTSNSSARRCAPTRHVHRAQFYTPAVLSQQTLCNLALQTRCTRRTLCTRPCTNAAPRACPCTLVAAQREGTPVVHIADTRLNFRQAAGSVAVVARPPDSTRQLTHPLHYHLPTVPPTHTPPPTRPPRRACSS